MGCALGSSSNLRPADDLHSWRLSQVRAHIGCSLSIFVLFFKSIHSPCTCTHTYTCVHTDTHLFSTRIAVVAYGSMNMPWSGYSQLYFSLSLWHLTLNSTSLNSVDSLIHRCFSTITTMELHGCGRLNLWLQRNHGSWGLTRINPRIAHGQVQWMCPLCVGSRPRYDAVSVSACAVISWGETAEWALRLGEARRELELQVSVDC